MKILVIGGTGELGRRLIPQPIADKHAVLATSRSDHRLHTIRSLGATAIALDLLDADAVWMACAGFRPGVIVHQATSLSGIRSLRHFDRQFRPPNRLRTEGLRILMEAAWAFVVTRLVVQSFTGWPNNHTGSAIMIEVDPLDTDALPAMQQTFDPIKELEARALGTSMRASSGSTRRTQFAQLLVGAPMVLMMTTARGSSNAKARAVLGWEPEWPSWRAAVRHALGD